MLWLKGHLGSVFQHAFKQPSIDQAPQERSRDKEHLVVAIWEFHSADKD